MLSETGALSETLSEHQASIVEQKKRNVVELFLQQTEAVPEMTIAVLFQEHVQAMTERGTMLEHRPVPHVVLVEPKLFGF